jgi:hypothetical protein
VASRGLVQRNHPAAHRLKQSGSSAFCSTVRSGSGWRPFRSDAVQGCLLDRSTFQAFQALLQTGIVFKMFLFLSVSGRASRFGSGLNRSPGRQWVVKSGLNHRRETSFGETPSSWNGRISSRTGSSRRTTTGHLLVPETWLSDLERVAVQCLSAVKLAPSDPGRRRMLRALFPTGQTRQG